VIPRYKVQRDFRFILEIGLPGQWGELLLLARKLNPAHSGEHNENELDVLTF
jgi:hypothetical protein